MSRSKKNRNTGKAGNKGKVIDRLWAVSLFVCGASGILFGVFGITGRIMPEVLVRVIGVLDILALPVLGYTTVRKMKGSGQ